MWKGKIKEKEIVKRTDVERKAREGRKNNVEMKNGERKYAKRKKGERREE